MCLILHDRYGLLLLGCYSAATHEHHPGLEEGGDVVVGAEDGEVAGREAFAVLQEEPRPVAYQHLHAPPQARRGRVV